jgi:ribonuclease HI
MLPKSRSQSDLKKFELYCDGASRGNPGPGAYGFVVFEDNRILAQEGQTLGEVTNNIAEYQGLVRGLEKCVELKGEEVSVRSDSELLVKQLKGEYRVRAPHLLKLYNKAISLLQRFKRVEIQHIRREGNHLADSLCNQALDGRPIR